VNKLEQLRQMTTVVADTGEIDAIRRCAPVDATTNPSLLFKAAQQPEYAELVNSAIAFGKQGHTSGKRLQMTLDKISVNFGVEILKLIPGRVSTEVDARLSFDTAATIAKAERLIELYQAAGVERERILIKIAATWEGIKAAEYLEKEGIHCNLTLMFSLAQAMACAEAGVTLISPFVGRILDWHKKAAGVDAFAAHEDPGVVSVTSIYDYYKTFDYQTVVMGASFRNTDEILELAGCDLLTIAPPLMAELENSSGELTRKLSPVFAKEKGVTRLEMDQVHFRWMMNDDAMATEKLAEGIRGFTADTLKLEQFVSQQAQYKAA